MINFISCDWGTSSFRICLVSCSSLEIIHAYKSEKGIGQIYQGLTEAQRDDPRLREKAYFEVIKKGIESLEEMAGVSLSGTLVICSGMATSSIGLIELPFTPIPFSTDGRGLGMEFLPADSSFANPIVLLSGIKHSHDLMRGEETQLVGVLHQLANFEGNGIFVFPGTHSKHIRVMEQEVVDFTTYMTGELFALMSKQSILQSNLRPGGDLLEDSQRASFLEGVRDSGNSNLLSQFFQIRIAHLLHGRDPKLNFLYLSGLLIGAELQALVTKKEEVFLCASGELHHSYALAMENLSISTKVVPPQVVEHSVIAGQYKIYNQKLNHERSIFLGNI
jgi:2-dehydro-3-deoxygalactonokinase